MRLKLTLYRGGDGDPPNPPHWDSTVACSKHAEGALAYALGGLALGSVRKFEVEPSWEECSECARLEAAREEGRQQARDA